MFYTVDSEESIPVLFALSTSRTAQYVASTARWTRRIILPVEN
jgi:hypothetical protein